MLLTFFQQVRCGVKQCCITHSLSTRDWIDNSAYYDDRLTHSLLLIWCTMRSLTKNQNWVMSLTFCKLWDKTADYKRRHYSQTVVVRLKQYTRSMLVQCDLPTDINIIRSCHQDSIWWQPTCTSLNCSLAIRSMTNIVLMWRFGVLLTSWSTFASSYHSIWSPPTSLFAYHHLNFPMLMCSLTKMHTQKCGNFEKTMRMTSSHVQLLSQCFRTCLNNVNVSKWHCGCDPHWSADLTQRSRLFICVETNSWCMLWSSIASAVFWVNSAQFFSGKSMSVNQHYSHFSRRNLHHSHLPIAHMPWEDIWHPKL